jgi:hypothetical protein
VTLHERITCRFIPQESTAEQLDLITTPNGQQVQVAYSVLFLPEVEILEGDLIVREDDGSDWFVGKLYKIPSWRRVAQVARNVG